MSNSVRNPQWANAGHTAVDMEIDHVRFGWIHFSASPDDGEDHCRALYSAAVAGEFGVIAEYVAPPPPTPEQINAGIKADIVRMEREQIMPRATREFMLTLFKAQAAAGGITEAMLVDPQHPAYSAAYKKLKDFDTVIVGLRAQL